MIERPFWIRKIEKAWAKRSIVWLSGVRRVGKTTLSKMFSEAIYLNCDLPSVVRTLEDPEYFYEGLEKEKIVILDEVHRIENPSRLLKIGADAYPHIKILATGSSTLAATKKFQDSLAGRKQTIYLSPVLWSECLDTFKIKDLDKRLFHGGLPEPLLDDHKDPSFFSEWMDSFYARDIQELFGIRNRIGFMKLIQLLLRQSGGLVDYTNLARLSDISRPTVKAHIEAMCIAHAAFLLSPFSGGGRREITKRPKCYAFDTGFVSHARGWEGLRNEDKGLLWEHLILDTLRTIMDVSRLYYWQDKSGREVDFVIKGSSKKVHAIECKIHPDHFNMKSLIIFRSQYPNGDNYVISPYIDKPYKTRKDDLEITYCSLSDLPGMI